MNANIPAEVSEGWEIRGVEVVGETLSDDGAPGESQGTQH